MRHVAALGLVTVLGIAGCAALPGPEITVYTKRDFRGEGATLRDAYPDLRQDFYDFDEEISSFEIHRGVWEVCKEPGYGDCRIADRSMPDLGDWDLDNAIRSLRPLED